MILSSRYRQNTTQRCTPVSEIEDGNETIRKTKNVHHCTKKERQHHI